MASVTIMDVPVPPELYETGHTGGLNVAYHHALGPGYVAQSYEENPELTGTAFVAVADRMRRTDGQVGALLRSIVLPQLRNTYRLASNGCSAKVVKLVETEIGLHGLDPERPRRAGRRGVLLKEHLRQALLSVPLGYMPFQRVYQVGAPHPDQNVPGMPDQVAHLARLSPRLPRTVQEIRVTRTGELAGIIQAPIGWDAANRTGDVHVVGGVGSGGALNESDMTETWIESKYLAYYCFEREGADWAGTSLLRPVYKDWLLKDQMIRTDAIAGERNGLGIPVVYYSQDGNRAEALEIAQSLRAGAAAGAALEDGKYRIEMQGVTGQVRDLLPSIKYHDQSVSRSALAMFLDLGQTSSGLGQGGLGDTFLSYFVMALQHVNDWVCDEFTESVIRDLVEVNFGPNEPYPALVCDEISAESSPTAEALKALVDAKIITPDEVLEDTTRRRYNLGARDPDAAPVDRNPTPPPPPPTPSVTPASVADVDPDTLDDPPTAPVPAANTELAAADPLLAHAEHLLARLAALRAGD